MKIEEKKMGKAKDQRKWVREEVVILVGEYFKNKHLSDDEIDKSYIRISEFLRKREQMITSKSVDDVFRNYAGIRIQTGRIRCADPDTKLSGIQVTKLQREVVAEYLDNPQRIFGEMEEIYLKYE